MNTKTGSNMIVWIDGANGVGKSHVAAELAVILADKNTEYLESDLYWDDLVQNDSGKNITGCNPYYDEYFISVFRKVIEEKHNSGKMPIISMSLVYGLCERELLDYFKKKGLSMLHIILEAKKETIISRIENDSIRDEGAQNQQKAKVSRQIQYLETQYPDAVRIGTDDKSLTEIVNEIKMLL